MSYVFEVHETGTLDLAKIDADAGRPHGPARRFLEQASAEIDPERYRDLIAERGTLAAFPTRKEWIAAESFSLGDLVQRCMEEIQKSVIREGKLLARIEELEATVKRMHNSTPSS